MLTVLLFLVVLSVLVLVHEFGHYVAARIVGVKAEEFGYGFPPRLLGFIKEKAGWRRAKRGEQSVPGKTIWSVNWLPIGGFVRLKGELGEGGNDQDSFQAKPAWHRFFILGAGVAMNWLLAALIFSVAFSIGVPTELSSLPSSAIITDRGVQVTEVLPASAADEAKLLPGDHITQVNGIAVKDAAHARDLLSQAAANQTVTLVARTDGAEPRTVKTALRFLEELGHPGLGVALADIGTVRYPVPIALLEGVRLTATYTWMVVAGFGSLVKDLVSGLKPNADITGPVGIAVMTGRIAEQGTWSLMHFTAILSINLAVINFLPIPALDGGRVLFLIIEAVRRRKVHLNTEALVHRIGFLFLLILILLVTLQDLRRFGGVILHGLGLAINFPT